MAPAVALADVSVRFAGRWALAHVSAEIPRGATVLLTGDNGAGKTTLLRVIATALRPTRGDVRLFGVPIASQRESLRRRSAFVGHPSHFYETMTAREALALVAALAGHAARPSADCLREVGLSADAERPIATFSAGMKRRLCLARLLLLEPELVLLDEPFTALDPTGVELAAAIITKLKDAGVTTLIASHDHARTRPLCSHAMRLGAGQLVAPLHVLS